MDPSPNPTNGFRLEWDWTTRKMTVVTGSNGSSRDSQLHPKLPVKFARQQRGESELGCAAVDDGRQYELKDFGKVPQLTLTPHGTCHGNLSALMRVAIAIQYNDEDCNHTPHPRRA